MEKPKTYMLRLYPDRAGDRVLINYLKNEKNIQQYLKKLIEQDLKKESVEDTVRKVMEEYFPLILSKTMQKNDTVIEEIKEDIQDFSKTEESKKEDTQTKDVEESSEEKTETENVEQITEEALAFLAGFE